MELIITPANENDGELEPDLIEKVAQTNSQPLRYVIMDAGYNQGKNYEAVYQKGAQAIIPLNLRNEKSLRRVFLPMEQNYVFIASNAYSQFWFHYYSRPNYPCLLFLFLMETQPQKFSHSSYFQTMDRYFHCLHAR